MPGRLFRRMRLKRRPDNAKTFISIMCLRTAMVDLLFITGQIIINWVRAKSNLYQINK